MVISMFLWGLSWPSGKALTHYCSAINFSVYRYIIVVATFFPLLFFTKTKVKLTKRGIPPVIASGVLLALYSYLFYKGLKTGAAGAGGVLVTTLNPIVSYLIGIVLSKAAPSKNETFGLLLGLIAGSILLKIWSNPGSVFASGNVYFLLASVSWAAMSKITSWGHIYGASLGFTFWQYLITLICMLPLADMQEARTVIYIHDAVFWGNLFFGAAIITSLATTLYFYTTTRLGAEKASSFIFLVPFSAAFSSWLFLGEKVMLHTIIGGALGMVAVYMINKRKPVIIVEPD